MISTALPSNHGTWIGLWSFSTSFRIGVCALFLILIWNLLPSYTTLPDMSINFRNNWGASTFSKRLRSCANRRYNVSAITVHKTSKCIRTIIGDESALRLKNATSSDNLFSTRHRFAYTTRTSFKGRSLLFVKMNVGLMRPWSFYALPVCYKFLHFTCFFASQYICSCIQDYVTFAVLDEYSICPFHSFSFCTAPHLLHFRFIPIVRDRVESRLMKLLE